MNGKVLCACLFSLLIVPGLVSATPRLSAARSAAEQVARAQDNFKKKYAKLSAAEKAEFLESIGEGRRRTRILSTDSDNDGLPDFMDGPAAKTNTCDTDSDDDGLDDGDEVDREKDPGDDDSDDDGCKDGDEKKVAGPVDALGTNEVVVSGIGFVITEKTEFKHLSREELAVGLCVEVLGQIVQPNEVKSSGTPHDDDDPPVAGTLVATKIKKFDHCDKDRDDEHDDHEK